VQGLIAAGIDPGGVRRHGRSGLDYLAAQRGADGHYRYSSSSDQTPVWVTGQALVAARQHSFPIPAVARASSGSESSAARIRAGGRLSSLRGSASGVGEGRPLSPGRFGKQQGRPQRDAGAGGSGEAPADPQPGAPSASTEATTNSGSPSDSDGGSEGDGGSSPLLPVGIGLAVAIVVLGGGWLASRRLTASS
jgi:hypothetical protein